MIRSETLMYTTLSLLCLVAVAFGWVIVYTRRKVKEIKQDYDSRMALPPAMDIVGQIALRTWAMSSVSLHHTLSEWRDYVHAACVWRKGHHGVYNLYYEDGAETLEMIRIPKSLTWKYSRKKRMRVPTLRFPKPRYSSKVVKYNLRKWMFCCNVQDLVIIPPEKVVRDHIPEEDASMPPTQLLEGGL